MYEVSPGAIAGADPIAEGAFAVIGDRPQVRRRMGRCLGMEKPKDRRRHPRSGISRDAKLFHRGTWTYIPCRTIDASALGLLVQVKGGRPVAVGDIVDAAVGWTGEPLVRSGEFISAKVVRVDTTPDGDSLTALALTREVIGLAQYIQAA